MHCSPRERRRSMSRRPMSEILYDSDASLRLIASELRHILTRDCPTDPERILEAIRQADGDSSDSAPLGSPSPAFQG
jgi:hypothetical protein